MRKANVVDIKAALDEDNTSLTSLQGFLSKRSRRGTWQKRYFCISNQYFNYFASKKMVHLGATCDLSELLEDPSLVDRFGAFVLKHPDGEVNLKAKNLTEATNWMKVITERRNYYTNGPGGKLLLNTDIDTCNAVPASPKTPSGLPSKLLSSPKSLVDFFTTSNDGEESIRSFSSARSQTSPMMTKMKRMATGRSSTVRARGETWEEEAESKCVKSGTLMKKSPSRFKAWQARHCRLVDGALYYYKTEKHDFGDFQGRIVFDKSCEIRIPKESEDTCRFDIVTPFRIFELKAESEKVRGEWINVLEEHRNVVESSRKQLVENLAKLHDQEFNEEKSRLEQEMEERVPAWMQEWDGTDHIERLERIQKKLEAKFSHTHENVDKMIIGATSLIEELDELSSVCLGPLNRPDILTEYVRAYHLRAEHEVGFFLSGNRFEELTMNDILRLLDLVTAYDDFMSKLLEGTHGELLREKLPPSTMSDNVELLAGQYLSQLQDSLGTWIENIISANFARGESCVETVTQGGTILCTSAPVDIFNMLNETLVMARQSGVQQLEGAVLSHCLVALADYITTVCHDIQRTSRGKMLSRDLKFLCAMTNDCFQAMDHLENFMKGDRGVMLKACGMDWEPIRKRYDQAAFQFLSLILAMIQADIEVLEKQLFTGAHLDVTREDLASNVMARLAATLQDYLGDVKLFMYPFYFNKLIRLIIRDVAVNYCNKFLALSNVFSSPAKHVDEIFPTGLSKPTHGSFSPLLARENLSLDDIFHMQADRDGILGTLPPFVSGSAQFFSKEFLAWNAIVDLMTVSPAYFPSAAVKLCQSQPTAVQRAILATTLCCLSLRMDINNAQRSEILRSLSSGLWETRVAKNFAVPEQNSEDQGEAYLRLWPNLTIDNQISTQLKSLGNKAKASVKAQVPSPKNKPTFTPAHLRGDSQDGKPTEPVADAKLIGDSKSKGKKVAFTNVAIEVESKALDDEKRKIPGTTDSEPSGRNGRAGSVFEKMSVDLSEAASLARKRERMALLDVTEDIRDVDLHGYLEKRSRTPPHHWKQRFFMVHKAFEERSQKWKLALSGHDSHHTPVVWRVFLDEVTKIDLVTPLPVRLAADGISLVLVNDKLPKTRSGDLGYAFNIKTKDCTYNLRAVSMSETVTWVNGLNKSIREARRIANVLNTTEAHSLKKTVSGGGSSSSASTFSSLDMTQLRSLCASKGFEVTPESSKAEMVDMLEKAASEEHDKNIMAAKADEEEKRKLLLAKPVSELQSTCEMNGLDSSECTTKTELVNLISSRNIGIDRFDQEAHLRQLVARGLTLLEEEDMAQSSSDGSGSPASIENAIAIFERVTREASSAGFPLIEARAIHGLASAYSMSQDRRDAAPLMFEMASNMFLTAGEKSDARSCAIDASELYRVGGQHEEAIRVLVDYDSKTRSLDFSNQIEEIRQDMQKKSKPASRMSRFSGLFH